MRRARAHATASVALAVVFAGAAALSTRDTRAAPASVVVVPAGRASFQAAQAAGQRAGTPPAGQRGRGGRGQVAVMSLSTPAWPDGSEIPARYAQAGPEVSPPLQWSGVPDGTQSFVLLVHDVDAVGGATGFDTTLHWLVWNIPAGATGLPEGVPAGAQLPDGSRQISATGPEYRGPAAPAGGPVHHYLFELYALDTTVNVPPTGASPAETRAAVVAAMAGRIRGKAVMVGRYRR